MQGYMGHQIDVECRAMVNQYISNPICILTVWHCYDQISDILYLSNIQDKFPVDLWC